MREMRDDFYSPEQIKLLLDMATKANEEYDVDDIFFLEKKMFEAFKIGRAFQECFYEREMEEIAEKAFPSKSKKRK